MHVDREGNHGRLPLQSGPTSVVIALRCRAPFKSAITTKRTSTVSNNWLDGFARTPMATQPITNTSSAMKNRFIVFGEYILDNPAQWEFDRENPSGDASLSRRTRGDERTRVTGVIR